MEDIYMWVSFVVFIVVCIGIILGMMNGKIT